MQAGKEKICMKKKTKDIQYRLQKERNLWIIYMGLALFSPCYLINVVIYIEEKRFMEGSYIFVVFSLAYILYLLYAKYSKIKRIILSHFGVRHDAEIVRAKYQNGSGRLAGFSFYFRDRFYQ